MKYYARVNNGNVLNTIVVKDDVNPDNIFSDEPGQWIEYTPNTFGGVSINPEDGQPDGGRAIRKNSAMIGGTYDESLDAFIPPMPPVSIYGNTILNKETCLWEKV